MRVDHTDLDHMSHLDQSELRTLIAIPCKISCTEAEHEVQEKVRRTISTSTVSCDLDNMINVNIDSNIKICPKGKKFFE